MALKTKIQINVNGAYIKGHIIDGIFNSSHDSIVSGGGRDRSRYSEEFVRSAIEELNELADLMSGMIVADKLTIDEEKNEQIDWASGNANVGLINSIDEEDNIWDNF